MPYVRITVLLRDGTKRTGVRHFPSPINLEDIRKHAFQLSADVLGRAMIEDVTVAEVPADDPAVVAIILEQQQKKNAAAPRDANREAVTRHRRERR